MFEPDMKLKLFDEPNADVPFTFLLTDNKFNVGEVGHNFEAITGISPAAIKNLEQEKDRTL
jgi:hypothetical protein